jgi:hypothetical protein
MADRDECGDRSRGTFHLTKRSSIGERPRPEEATMTKDEMIRAYIRNGASWPALVFVYAILVGTMVISAQVMA